MRLWRALECVPAWCGVRSVWQEHMGEELDYLAPLLRPLDQLALSVPWPGTIQGRRVVVHAEDDIVAIDEETSEASAIDREDIVLWKLEPEPFLRGIASVMGLQGAPASIGMGNRLWWLGEYVPVEGERFPVYLATSRDAGELLKSAGLVSALAQRPFVLATPTRCASSEPLQRLVEGRAAAWLALEEVVAWEGEGVFTAKRALAQALAPFTQRHIAPLKDKTAGPRFPTPPGSRWEDVRIRFTDAHTVSVSVGGAAGTYDFASMGMGIARTRKPDKQWALLYAFAKEHGSLDWKSSHASPRNQKRRERLAKQLRAFFGIEGDPIALEGSGWRVRFRLDPDC